MNAEQRVGLLEKEIVGMKKELADQRIVLLEHISKENEGSQDIKEFIGDVTKALEYMFKNEKI